MPTHMLSHLRESHWTECSFLAIDVEGNGRQPLDLVELAIVEINGGKVSSSHAEWLVRPSESISWQANRIHGITNDDVSGSPRFDEICDDVHGILGTKAIIGHKVSVDRQLLQQKIPTWQPCVALDTWKLAKKVNPTLKSYTLSALCDEFGLNELLEGTPHRAAYDAFAAAYLFVALVEKLDIDGELTLHALAEIAAGADDPFFIVTQDLFQ